MTINNTLFVESTSDCQTIFEDFGLNYLWIIGLHNHLKEMGEMHILITLMMIIRFLLRICYGQIITCSQTTRNLESTYIILLLIIGVMIQQTKNHCILSKQIIINHSLSLKTQSILILRWECPLFIKIGMLEKLHI